MLYAITREETRISGRQLTDSATLSSTVHSEHCFSLRRPEDSFPPENRAGSQNAFMIDSSIHDRKSVQSTPWVLGT